MKSILSKRPAPSYNYEHQRIEEKRGQCAEPCIEGEEWYKDFPFVRALIHERQNRKTAFSQSGKVINSGLKSNGNWLRTVFTLRARAVDVFFVPWILVTVNASLWTFLIKVPLKEKFNISPDSWDTLYSLFLTTALAFLLVFRLNRVAIRWWDTRRMWGAIVAQSRILASCILEHTNHDPIHRDQAIGWLAGFVVSAKQNIRNEKLLSKDELSGFLTPYQVESLSSSAHPCLEACAELRHALKLAFRITPETPFGVAAAFSSEMRLMEQSLFELINEMGGLERVRSTPLPLVFVTHLRTFLFIYLLSLPYMYAHQWGWATIPMVTITSYALLGIDGAASECESPFLRNRLNHLDMEDFCSTALSNIEQLVIHNANMQLRLQT